MIARGALHVHTNLSHDGLWSIHEMVAFFRGKHYDFVCIAEHSEDISEDKRQYLRSTCARLSTPDFCVIPGVEYSCSGLLHIAGIGCDLLLDVSDPVELAYSIRRANGFAVLAHPRRIKWRCPDTLLEAVNAIEAWNIRYDSKFVPIPASIDFVEHARSVNPSLLAAVGLDLHAERGFYPAATRLIVDRLDRDSILSALIDGRYALESPLWKLHAMAAMTTEARLRLRVLRTAMECARSWRDRFAGKGESQ